jgi:pyruvate dehydrogenase E1 component
VPEENEAGTAPQTDRPAPAAPPVIHEGLPTQLPDIDPDETADWVDSFDALIDERDANGLGT